jgi:hypothetical protein
MLGKIHKKGTQVKGLDAVSAGSKKKRSEMNEKEAVT